MGKSVSILSVLASGMFLIAACGAPAATPAPTSAPTAVPATAPAATSAPQATEATASATVKTAKVMTADSSLGKILVDEAGWTLYMYTKDSDGTTVCYDKCATAWPPLLTKDKAAAGDGVDAALLGTTTRKDGTLQVTYKGMPLYYYAKDKAAGDVTGQDVGSVWYVLAPNGDVIK